MLRLKLAGRVYAAAFLTLALCLVVFGAWQAREQAEVYRDIAAREALSGAAYIGKLVEHDLVIRDYASIDQAVQGLMPLSIVLRVQVVEPDGTVLTDAGRGRGGEPESQLQPSPAKIALPRQAAPTVLWENDMIVAFQPVESGKPLGWVKASYGTAQLQAMQRALAARTLLLATLFALLSLAILYLVLRRPIGAIRVLSAFARNLSGRPGEQVALPPSPVEIEQLAAALNTASAELKQKESLQAQLLHAQKMEAVGHLAGGIAHDFNNILTAIIGYAQLLSRRVPPGDPVRDGLDQILNSAERAASLTRSLLAFSRKQRVEMRRIDLNATIRDIEKIVRRVLGEDVELRLALPPEALPVMADSGQLGQLLVNLAANARDAMHDGGTFTLATRECGPPPGLSGRWAELTATDTGTGIDPRVAQHIFEPFFTTKEVGKGTGLGLAIVHGIVAQHGGMVEVVCPAEGGSVFRIVLPLAAGAEAAPPLPVAEVRPGPGEGTILLAEDEPDVRRVIRMTLEEAGYRVVEAANGREAIARLESGGTTVDLLVSDVVMPGMNGLELVEAVRAIVPGMPALLMSGYSAELVDRKGALPANVRLLAKPSSPDAIVRAVAASIRNSGSS